MPKLTLIDSFVEAEMFMSWLSERRPVLAVDTETEGLDWWRDRVRLVQLGDTQRAWAMRWDRWSGLVQEALKRYTGRIAMHNFKFDTLMMRALGIDVPTLRVDDTRTMAHILDSSRRTGLKPLADSLLGAGSSGSQSDLKQMMSAHKWDWKDVPFELEEYWVYACLDTCLTAGIWEILDSQLTGKQRELYDVEMAAQEAIMRMEIRGCRIDLDYCVDKSVDLENAAEDIKDDILREYGIKNINSAAQVTSVLIAQGWEPDEFTESGKPKFTKEIIARISGQFPLAGDVRHAKKLLHYASGYLDKLVEFADRDVIHPSINPLGARTGRMSVSRPPLQQMPKEALIRNAFIPRNGNKLIAIDYDQMEVILTANLSGDPSLIDAINTGQDIHRYTASKVYDCTIENVTAKQRQTAKNAVYAIIYGAGIERFSATAGIDVSSGADFMRRFDNLFPGIERWKRNLADELSANSDVDGWTHTETQLGRIQRAETSKSYVLVNYLVQGTGADILKLKIAELANAGLDEYMVLPIHDEILFDAPADIAEDVLKKASQIMTHSEPGKITLTVDGAVLDSWGDKYK